MAGSAGRALLHYQLLERIGQGGMGEVYLAHDTRLERRVALKLLPPELAVDPERRRRFEREARALAALNHPHIVTIYSVEQVGGLNFITMEWVKGRTLKEAIPRGGLPAERFFELAIPLADALGAAHQRGIVHRDLKPANVMVTDEGAVKILDFGLARLRAGDPEAPPSEVPTQDPLTVGRVLGTLPYMSPEQVQGRPVDHRSDIFSLGIVLYEMATGERPFVGETSADVISSIIRDAPSSVTQLRPDLPRHLGRIIKRCLEKDPVRRFQSALDLRNDLEDLRGEQGSGDGGLKGGARLRGRSTARRGWLAATAIIVLAGLAIAVATKFRPWDRAGRAGPGGSPGPVLITPITTSGDARAAAISPRGEYIACIRRRGTQYGLHVIQVTTRSDAEIVPATDRRLLRPSFSPDGSYVYFLRTAKETAWSNDLLRVPTLGGSPQKLIVDIDSPVAFSPDGKKIAFIRGYVKTDSSAGASSYLEDLLLVADADGTAEREVAAARHPCLFAWGRPSWSPDGSLIAVGASDGSGSWRVALISRDTGAQRVIESRSFYGIGGIVWPSDSGEILFNAAESPDSGSSLWRCSYPDGQISRLTSGLSFLSDLGYVDLSIAADARSLVAVQDLGTRAIWVVPAEGKGVPRQISANPRDLDGLGGFCWTPEGRIVFGSVAGGQRDLWIMNADGSRRERLTTEGVYWLWPRVPRGGDRVFFCSRRGGRTGLWSMNLDGSGLSQIVDDETAKSPDCSPDGQWVYYLSGEPAKQTVWRISREGGRPVKLNDSPVSFFHRVSPDGKWIAALGEKEGGGGHAFIIFPSTGGPVSKRINHPSSEPMARDFAWAPDGKSLAYPAYAGQNVWRFPLDGGEPVQITAFDPGTSERISFVDWSPDGKTLALVRSSDRGDVVLITGF